MGTVNVDNILEYFQYNYKILLTYLSYLQTYSNINSNPDGSYVSLTLTVRCQ